jgi:hypothetical protein
MTAFSAGGALAAPFLKSIPADEAYSDLISVDKVNEKIIEIE